MHRLNSIDSQPSQREVGCCPTSSPEQHPIWGWIKSHQVFIQAIIVWMLMCLPYNIVTLVLYGKVTSSGSDLATDNITTSRELTVTVYLNLCFNFFIESPIGPRNGNREKLLWDIESRRRLSECYLIRYWWSESMPENPSKSFWMGSRLLSKLFFPWVCPPAFSIGLGSSDWQMQALLAINE